MKVLRIVLLLLWGVELFALDISGNYKGFYRYFDQRRAHIIGNFAMTIKQEGNAIYGVIKEPRTNFGPHQPYLYSDFKGKVVGDENSFTLEYIKTYRYKKTHTVAYKGTFKNYTGEVEGIWNIGSYQGDFKIFGFNPKEEFDTQAPKLLITYPFVNLIGSATASQTIKKIQTDQPLTLIEGIASDNVEIARIKINNQEAKIIEASQDEKAMIVGNSVKFTFPIVDSNITTYHLVATDTSGNAQEFTFSVEKTRGTQTPTPKADQDNRYRNKYAVLIGINAYAQWPALEFALNDAQSVEKHLKGLGYTTITLFDKEATRGNILKTLGYKLSQVIGENDAVLIYFAGHGHTENLVGGAKEGYIIPQDANTEDSFLSAISMHQLKSITQRIKAKHILFLMDSCYSGMGFARSGGIPKSDNEYINKIMSYRAVQMITAGSMDEQVLEEGGHGIFTKLLLEGLEGKADLDKDGYITGSELGTFLRPEVSKRSNYRQTPNFGRFEGEGEYIFHLTGEK